jgi:hypothetical protein
VLGRVSHLCPWQEATTNSRSRSSEACRSSTPRLPNCRRSRLVASFHLLFVYFPRLWGRPGDTQPSRLNPQQHVEPADLLFAHRQHRYDSSNVLTREYGDPAHRLIERETDARQDAGCVALNQSAHREADNFPMVVIDRLGIVGQKRVGPPPPAKASPPPRTPIKDQPQTDQRSRVRPSRWCARESGPSSASERPLPAPSICPSGRHCTRSGSSGYRSAPDRRSGRPGDFADRTFGSLHPALNSSMGFTRRIRASACAAYSPRRHAP